MTEIKKLVIKSSISNGENTNNSDKKTNYDDIQSVLEEFKKELFIEIDNRILELLERKAKK
jgi:hypothetical protein